jgi:NADH:ubiquinone oxidoreductase subunit 6 (subunit J)
VLGKGTTVERAYLILLDTMLLIYFIPYLYLFICYLVMNIGDAASAGRPWHERKPVAVLVGLAGLLLTIGAMVLATIPPSDTADPLLFRLKVIGGAAAFVLLGVLVYWRGRKPGKAV